MKLMIVLLLLCFVALTFAQFLCLDDHHCAAYCHVGHSCILGTCHCGVIGRRQTCTDGHACTCADGSVGHCDHAGVCHCHH